jgi:hypothetical protein
MGPTHESTNINGRIAPLNLLVAASFSLSVGCSGNPDAIRATEDAGAGLGPTGGTKSTSIISSIGATSSIGGSSQTGKSSSGGNSGPGTSPVGGTGGTKISGSNTNNNGGVNGQGGAPTQGGTQNAGGNSNSTGGSAMATGGNPTTGGSKSTGASATSGGTKPTSSTAISGGGSTATGGGATSGTSSSRGGTANTGGTRASGGTINTGGASTGGAAAGGVATGGAAAGGVATGGAAAGGVATGGATTGGAATGGAPTGGTCSTSCVSNATRCNSNTLQTCITGSDGCLTWGNDKPCNSPQICQGSGTNYACSCPTVAECTSYPNGAHCADTNTLITCASVNSCQQSSTAPCANLANETCVGAFPGSKCEVVFGYPTDGGASGTIAGSEIYGEQIQISGNLSKLTRLGVVTASSGTHVKLAIYDDNNGSPGTLQAAALSTSASVGNLIAGSGHNEFAINSPNPATTPVALAAGYYWIFAVFDATTTLRHGGTNVSSVYGSWSPWNAAFPTNFTGLTPDSLVYINFYVVGTP